MPKGFKGLFTEIKAVPNTNLLEEEYPIVWRCYGCGNTNGFTNHYDAWSGEYEVTCNKCGTDYTFQDGEGEPEHDCGKIGWDCWDCNKFLCEECWEWHPKTCEHEEEDYTCKGCRGD